MPPVHCLLLWRENLLTTFIDRLAVTVAGFDLAQGLGQLKGHAQTLFRFFPHHPEHHPEGAHRPGFLQVHLGRHVRESVEEIDNPRVGELLDNAVHPHEAVADGLDILRGVNRGEFGVRIENGLEEIE